MLSLTREEALEFIDNRLAVKDVEKLFVKDRFLLLNDLIVAFHNNIPFQTLTNLAVRPDIRRIPDYDEMKDDLFSGKGGMCIALNGFFHAVLLALGYDCYITAGRMWDNDIKSHAIIIVQNLRQTNDVFLVDVGLGYPTLNAVALDFELESPTVVELVWWGKFVRLHSENGEAERCPYFSRMRKPRHPADMGKFGFGHREVADQWNNVYEFKLEPQSFEELRNIVDVNIYQNVSHVLSRSLRLVQWKENRATIIINNHLMKEEEEGAFRYVLLETDKDIADAVVHEFPIFERDFVENVVKQWRQLCRTQSC